MTDVTELRAARVRVPCSTSNLGSGYDTIGLALERYLDAEFQPDDSGTLTLPDVFYLLDFLFDNGLAPVAPYPGCGEDATGDSLDCATPGCP